MTPNEFLIACMQLSARHRFRTTSYYRAPTSNTQVGGVKFSSHQYWVGMDVLLEAGESVPDFIESARRVGIKVLNEGDHLHLQPLTWTAG